MSAFGPINSTLIASISPIHFQPPIYYTPRSSVLPWVSDKWLSLAAPVVGYWVVSLTFHLLDTAKFPYFEARRLHESPEVLARNKVTVAEVVRAVIVQHVIQTALGWMWFEAEEEILKREVYVDHLEKMGNLAPYVARAVFVLCGKSGEDLLKQHGQGLVQWVYWWGIPAVQLFWAFIIMDAWEYWWHRACHMSTFLYRNFHSWHHRLYVPYAFGALYNHPLEGLVFDTLGAAVSHALSGMTMRQAILFFVISEVKTVDDHSGYKLWWDPFQFLFNNNADYHDIHHQAYGIKSNFSQPFFVSWDKWFGTQMTREQASQRIRPKIE